MDDEVFETEYLCRPTRYRVLVAIPTHYSGGYTNHVTFATQVQWISGKLSNGLVMRAELEREHVLKGEYAPLWLITLAQHPLADGPYLHFFDEACAAVQADDWEKFDSILCILEMQAEADNKPAKRTALDAHLVLAMTVDEVRASQGRPEIGGKLGAHRARRDYAVLSRESEDGVTT